MRVCYTQLRGSEATKAAVVWEVESAACELAPL